MLGLAYLTKLLNVNHGNGFLFLASQISWLIRMQMGHTWSSKHKFGLELHCNSRLFKNRLFNRELFNRELFKTMNLGLRSSGMNCQTFQVDCWQICTQGWTVHGWKLWGWKVGVEILGWKVRIAMSINQIWVHIMVVLIIIIFLVHTICVCFPDKQIICQSHSQVSTNKEEIPLSLRKWL